MTEKDPEQAGRTGGSKAWIVFKICGTGAVLVLLGRHIWSTWRGLAEYQWSVAPLMLCAAFVLRVLAMSYSGIVWALQVRRADITASTTRVAAGALLSRLGKYIPGKVWAVMGRGYFLSQEGPAVSSAMSLSALSQAVVVMSGLLWAIPVIPLVTGMPPWMPAVLATIPLLGLGVLHPSVLEWASAPVLRLLKRPPLRLNLSFADVIYWLLLAMTRKIPGGLAFCAFVAALVDISWFQVPLLICIAAAAGVSGLLAVFAPGGLGIREGVLILLLSDIIGPESAIVVALGWRLWTASVELLCAGGAWAWLQWSDISLDEAPAEAQGSSASVK